MFDPPEGTVPEWYDRLFTASPPRWAPVPDWGRRHRLDRVETVADMLGFELLDWQRLVLRLVTEVREDGIPSWFELTWIVPRQAGKSVSTLLAILVRMLFEGGSRSVYTAQAGVQGRLKLEHDWWPMLEGSLVRYGSGLRLRLGAFADLRMSNGSLCRILPGTRHGIRGVTNVSLVIADEALSEVDDTREQLLLPTLATRREGQIIIASTAGVGDSNWLRAKRSWAIKRGGFDTVSRRCLVEWSADPLSEDMDDPVVWERVHPGVSGGLIDVDFLRTQSGTMQADSFRREYLGVWEDDTRERGLSQVAWNRVCVTRRLGWQGELSLAVEASDDYDRVVAVVSDGRLVEVVDVREGGGDVLEWVERILERNRDITMISFRAGGPTGWVGRAFEQGRARRFKARVEMFSQRRFQFACARFYSHVLDGRVRVHRDAVLDHAVRSSARKISPSGLWAWDRLREGDFVAPVVAASIAYDAAVARLLEVGSGVSIMDVGSLEDDDLERMVKGFA